MTNRLDPFTRTNLLHRLPPPERRAEIRAIWNLSLSDISGSVGVTPQAVKFWEQGATPQDRNLRAYVELLEEIVARSSNGATDAPADAPFDPTSAA